MCMAATGRTRTRDNAASHQQLRKPQERHRGPSGSGSLGQMYGMSPDAWRSVEWATRLTRTMRIQLAWIVPLASFDRFRACKQGQ